jgi:hypothetical protein
MFHSDVLELDEESIMNSLIPPVSSATSDSGYANEAHQLSRPTLVTAKNWALAKSPPGFWDIPPQSGSIKAAMTNSVTISKNPEM